MNPHISVQTRERGLWALKHTAAVYLVAHAIFGGIMAVAWVFLFKGDLTFAPYIFIGELAPFQDWQLLGSWPVGLGCYIVALPATLVASAKIGSIRGEN